MVFLQQGQTKRAPRFRNLAATFLFFSPANGDQAQGTASAVLRYGMIDYDPHECFGAGILFRLAGSVIPRNITKARRFPYNFRISSSRACAVGAGGGCGGYDSERGAGQCGAIVLQRLRYPK